MDSSGTTQPLSDFEFSRLAAAVIRAPSADNSQPWTLARHAEGLVVGLDPAQPRTFFDFDGWASDVSLGAAIENVLQTAPALGLGAEVVALRERELLVRMRRLSEARTAPYERAVLTRHTNRGRFLRTPVPPDACDELRAALADAPEFRLRWLISAADRQRIISAVREAEYVRFTHAQIHSEFHQSLRFGAAQAGLADGLAADTLGIERFLVPALRLLKPWGVAVALNALGMHHFMVWRGATLPLGRAPLLGVLTCRGERSGVACGRALEKLWLAAEASGLAFQAFGALPLLLRRLQFSAPVDGLSARQRGRLLAADRGWRAMLGPDSQSESLGMVVRLGYPATAVPRSFRRQLERFIVEL